MIIALKIILKIETVGTQYSVTGYQLAKFWLSIVTSWVQTFPQSCKYLVPGTSFSLGHS